MTEQVNYKWMVCVRCFTFNHAPYIVDALNGFTMQDTNFPFVCCIVDDASKDGEQEIIKAFLRDNFDFEDKSVARNEKNDDYSLIFVQHRTNKNCFFSVVFLNYNHYSSQELRNRKYQYIAEWHDNAKYIALCEGDDYWIDSKKIQKQVDILNRNPLVSMVFTSFETVDKDRNKIYRPYFEEIKKRNEFDNVLQELFFANFILTLTICIRKSVLDSALYKNCNVSLDYSIFLSAAMLGRVCYISDVTGCYRDNPGSLINTRHDYINKIIEEVFIYYSKNFIRAKTTILSEKENEEVKNSISERCVRLKNYGLILWMIYHDRGMIWRIFKQVLLKIKKRISSKI